MNQISPTEMANQMADAKPDAPAPLLLDVREAWEVQICAIPQAVHMPMSEIIARVGELDPAMPIVCICHHGSRSAHVGQWLETQGFSQVSNLTGGIDAWSRDVDPTIARY